MTDFHDNTSANSRPPRQSSNKAQRMAGRRNRRQDSTQLPPKRHPSAQALLDNNYCVTIDRQLERSPISRARSLASAVIGRKGGNCSTPMVAATLAARTPPDPPPITIKSYLLIGI